LHLILYSSSSNGQAFSQVTFASEWMECGNIMRCCELNLNVPRTRSVRVILLSTIHKLDLTQIIDTVSGLAFMLSPGVPRVNTCWYMFHTDVQYLLTDQRSSRTCSSTCITSVAWSILPCLKSALQPIHVITSRGAEYLTTVPESDRRISTTTQEGNLLLSADHFVQVYLFISTG
jgi:hypothetical protein